MATFSVRDMHMPKPPRSTDNAMTNWLSWVSSQHILPRPQIANDALCPRCSMILSAMNLHDVKVRRPVYGVARQRPLHRAEP